MGRIRPFRRHKIEVGAAFAALVVITAAASFAFNTAGLRDRLGRDPLRARIQSLAVIPLANISGDPAQEYIPDGVTDALITDLAEIGSMKVISRTSSMQYKQTRKSLREIARELNMVIITGALTTISVLLFRIRRTPARLGSQSKAEHKLR